MVATDQARTRGPGDDCVGPAPDIVASLRDLPRSERADVLAELLAAEFKAVLLMTDDDELPFEQSFFDLGLTSLTLSDLKQRIEGLLGCEINANVLFNSPTIVRLLEYLTEGPLADLFAAARGGR